MITRLLILLLIMGACRSGEIACPEKKSVRLKKRPSNYMKSYSRSLSASMNERPNIHSRGEIPGQKHVKTISSIEEWDCPKPGTRAGIPKSVKENIRRNRKKFNSYYKKRSDTDSLHTAANPRIR